jgi:hypothetical protein
MSEIVERLKSMYITHTPSASYAQVDPVTIGEAADEITRLTAARAECERQYQEKVQEIIALTAEVERLRRCLAKQPNTYMIAYEDGRHRDLVDAVVQRDDAIDRLTARVAQLEGALEHTWKVLDAAGTLNLSNGVQLGPTVWYVKIEEAREMSRAALSQPAQPAPEKGGE